MSRRAGTGSSITMKVNRVRELAMDPNQPHCGYISLGELADYEFSKIQVTEKTTLNKLKSSVLSLLRIYVC